MKDLLANRSPWYRDRGAWRLIAREYLPWFGALSLSWEIAQLPLYTIWSEQSVAYIAFAVAHCTLGDMAIGSTALLLALILSRERSLEQWRWGRIALLAALFAAGYTIFSEWLNTAQLPSWTYSDAMPTVELAGIRLGLSPLLQWLVVLPLALYLARKTS